MDLTLSSKSSQSTKYVTVLLITFASVSDVIKGVSWLADALEATGRVPAAAALTQLTVLTALVDVCSRQQVTLACVRIGSARIKQRTQKTVAKLRALAALQSH